MSAGTQTSRAHDRDRAIEATILAVPDDRWRTAAEWHALMDPLVRPDLGYRCGRPQVAIVLRDLEVRGLVQRARLADRRCVAFRRNLRDGVASGPGPV